MNRARASRGSSGTQGIWSAPWLLALSASLLLVLSYNLFFFNRFFPIQEGWFSAYAHQILVGKTPYRDFYLFLQPLYPLTIAGVVKVFGYQFIVLRVFGLAERLLLTAVLFCLYKRLFRPSTSLLVTVVTIAVFTSNTTDVIYSYYQFCLVLALLGALLALRALRVGASRAPLWAGLAGLSGSLGFFTKQTTGLFVAAAVGVVFGVTLWRRRPRGWRRMAAAFVGGWAAPALVFGVWLGLAGALGPYLDQVYGGAAGSKGSLATTLFAFLGRDVTWSTAWPLLVLVAYAGSLALGTWWLRRARPNERAGRLRTVALGAVAITLAIWRFALSPRYSIVAVVLLGTAALAEVAGPWISRRLLGDPATRRGQEWVLIGLAFATLLGAIVWARANIVDSWFWFLHFHFAETKLSLVYWQFHLAFALSGYALWRVLRRPLGDRDVALALIAFCGLAVMYAHGLSYSIEEHAVAPTLGLVVGLVLEWPSALVRAKAVLVGGAAVMVVGLCVAQRLTWTYEWWGWREPSVRIARQRPLTPLLKGFRLGTFTDNTLSQVNGLVTRYAGAGWLFTFPSIPLFYVTSNDYPHTFALVHYWDVCPDDIAERDARTLLRDPPGVIVELQFSAKDWRFHERTFRGGKPSGQRAIEAALRQLTSAGGYRLVGSFKTVMDNPLKVWARVPAASSASP